MLTKKLFNSFSKMNSLRRTFSFFTHSKFNFTEMIEFKIANNDDIKYLERNVTKTDTPPIHLDMKEKKLTNKQFKEVFSCLQQISQEQFKLDLTNVEMTDEKIEAIKQCFGKWNIKHLELHLTNSKLSEKQFKSLIESIKGFKHLYFLNLEMENMGLTKSQKGEIENLLNDMDTLRNIYINIRNNTVDQQDMEVYKKLHRDVHIKTLLLL